MSHIPIITFFSTSDDAKNKASLVYNLANQLSATGKGVLCVDFSEKLNLARYFIHSVPELLKQNSYSKENILTKTQDVLINLPVYKSETKSNLQLLIGVFPNTERIHLNNITSELLEDHQKFIFESQELVTQLKEKATENELKYIFINLNTEISTSEKSIAIFSDLFINIIHLGEFINVYINRKTVFYFYRLLRNYFSITKKDLSYQPSQLFNRIIISPSNNLSNHDTAHNIDLMDKTYFNDALSIETTLAILPEFPSLIELADINDKSILDLTPADGAIGSHAEAVSRYREYIDDLASKMVDKSKFDS